MRGGDQGVLTGPRLAEGDRRNHEQRQQEFPTGGRRLSVFAAGRDGIHAEDVESARRDHAGVRHAGRGTRGDAGRFPDPAAMFAALDPVEIDRKIAELKIVENWLTMSVSMMQMSIKTMELQKASVEAMRGSMGASKK
jgi:hypothetical protein